MKDKVIKGMKFSIKGRKSIYTWYIIASGVLVSCISDTPETDYKDTETDSPATEFPDNNNQDNGDPNSGDSSDGNPDDENQATEPFKMTFRASEGNGQRASVDEDSMNGGNTNTFRWDAGDSIMVWTGDASSLTPCLFKTQNGGLGSALFEYEGNKVESKKYFGYYPYSSGLDYSRINITVPTDGSITQTVKGCSRHMAPYRPMYSSVVNRTESSDILTGLHFSHITSLLYFRVRNLSGRRVNLKGITVKCSQNVFSSSASLAFNPEGEASFNISENAKSDFTTLSFGDNGSGIAWENEEITTGFLPILPVEDLSGKTLTLILKVDNWEYISMEINNAESFKQAYFYRFGLTLKESGITVDSFIEEWEPGEDIIIPAKQ